MGKRKRGRRNYKFTEKKQSVRGAAACFGGALSLVVLVALLAQTILSRGAGGAYLGSVGVLALLLGVGSMIEALLALQEKDIFRTLPCVAAILSAVVTLAWMGLYLLGVLLP